MVSRADGLSLLTFVTSNAAKLAEVRSFLSARGIEVRAELRRLPEVQADELEEVVAAKLAAASDVSGTVLVEDSGLFVEALGGFPGPYSAYAFRTIGLEGIVRLVDGKSRAARFRTVAGLRLNGTPMYLRGEVEGTVALRPRGQRGFAYDPIFQPAGSLLTFGEMALSEKNRRSHRARALEAVLEAMRASTARAPSKSSTKE
ncbi:MAG: non-canonical purine NTP pyrophosphatase [Thermoplasmata archaeon]|nr:non-canonical purine NTP pyrophosphatase [Thermoplasmata archaeon]